MARKKKANFEIFSLSFLDCICCGFGAVILIFVLTTGQAVNVREYFLEHSSQSIHVSEEELKMKKAELEQLIAQVDNLEKRKADQDRNQSILQEIQAELDETESRIEQQKLLLRGKSQEIAVLEKIIETESVQQIEPEYLTNFSVEGKRILILFEASGGMLGNNVNEAMEWLAKNQTQRLKAPKWNRVIRSVLSIIRYLPEESEFQLVAWNENLQAFPINKALGTWHSVKDSNIRKELEGDLFQFSAQGGSNMEQAFLFASQQQADNVILLTDGLPTKSNRLNVGGEVSESQRIQMFQLAMERLNHDIRVNILLYPMAGDPASTSYFWNLAHSHDGALICPEKNWPR